MVLCSSTAMALENGPELVEDVLVVGARDARPVRDVAANVDILKRDDLTASMAVTLSDALRYLPGVGTVAADNRFGATELSIRGLSGNRVVSLIDGVPVADQFDVGAFSNAGQDWLIADSVSRIEVLRGPASTLFGSDALAGVVAVVSREPYEYLQGGKQAGQASVTYNGSDASTNLTGAIAAGGDRVSGVLHLAALDGQERESSAGGVDDELERMRESAQGVVHVDLAPGHRLRLHGSYFTEEVDTNLISVLGYGRRYRSTTELQGDDRRSRLSLAVAYDFELGLDWLTSGSMQVFRQQTDAEQWTQEQRSLASGDVFLQRKFDFDVAASGLTLDLQSRWSHGDVLHRIGWGLHLQRARYSEYRDGRYLDLTTGVETNVLLGETMPVRDFPQSEVTEMGVYLHDEIEFGSVTLIPALRYERHQLSARDDVVFSGAVDDTVSRWVPKLGVIWRLDDSWSLFSQYAAGFKAPPFEDVNIGLDIALFNYRAIPNPDLNPETSHGLDFGMRFSRQDFTFSATAFLTRYDDFIASRVNVGIDPATSTTLFQSRNLDEAEIYGIEVEVDQDLGRWIEGLSWHARANWTRGEDRKTGEPLASVEPLEVIGSLRWQALESLQLSLHGTFVDGQRQIDIPRGTAFIPAGFGIWDAAVAYQPDEKTQIRLGVFNLTDKTHWRWGAVRGRDAGDPLVAVMAQPGRHISMSIHRRIGG